MNSNVLGILISFGFVFLVLGGATLAGRLWRLEGETTRKIIHIALCNWVFVAFPFFTGALWACVAPASFILLNYFSHKKNLVAAMERGRDDTLGTVWYAVSLLLLTGASFALGIPAVAMCGMAAMGYGDGFAALVGRRWGRGLAGGKSVLGSLTMAAATFVSVLLVCRFHLPAYAWRTALLCAPLAALLELCSPRGLDNLTVPLTVGLAVWLLASSKGLLFGLLLCLCVTYWILLIARGAGSITGGAFLAAYVLGVSLYLLGGWSVYGALITFFVFGSVLSRVGRGTSTKADASRLHHRRGARTAWQVAANGGPALLFLVAWALLRRESLLLAGLACFAGASADTFSSELGMLSRRQPVSLLSGKPVQPGLSGGVTPLGLCGAALGSLLLSLFALPWGLRAAGPVFLCGIACSLLDSLLGAGLQAKYSLPGGALTERPLLEGAPLPLAEGLAFVNNDVVNFTSILTCGLLAALLLR